MHAEPESRLSRKAAWLAMGAVTLGPALIWIAPGIEHVDEHRGRREARAALLASAEDDAARRQAARLDFQLKDMNGVDVKLDSFKGKVILLNFWATWCGPCKAEIPSLVELQEKYPDDLVVLGFSVDDPAEKIKPYADEIQGQLPGARRQWTRRRPGCLRPAVRHSGVGDHRARRRHREATHRHRHQGTVRTGDPGPAVV